MTVLWLWIQIRFILKISQDNLLYIHFKNLKHVLSPPGCLIKLGDRSFMELLSQFSVHAKSLYICFQLVERLPRTQRKESGILHRVSGSFKGQEDKKIFISNSASGLNNWLIIGSTWCMLCLIQPWADDTTRSLSIDFCVDFFVAGGGGAFFRMSYLHEFTDGIN